MPRPGIGLSPPGGMGAPDSGMDLGGDAGPDDATEGEFEPADDFEREAKDFMDDSLPMADRVSALKEAIHQCFSEYESKPHDEYGSGSGGGSGGGGGKSKGSGLLLALGLPKGGKKG